MGTPIATKTVCSAMSVSVVSLTKHLYNKITKALNFLDRSTNTWSCSLTVFLAQEVCFSFFSYGLQSLYQLLVRWIGGDSQPCSEHIPPTGLEVPWVLLLNLFQLGIFHPKLKAQFIPLSDLDQNEIFHLWSLGTWHKKITTHQDLNLIATAGWSSIYGIC